MATVIMVLIGLFLVGGAIALSCDRHAHQV